MKLLTRALAALPALAFTTSLLAAGPAWTLKPGSEVLLTPAGGSASVTLLTLDAEHTRVTLNARTALTVTPDPLGEPTSRQWVLPAGAELVLSLTPGQSLRRMDLAQSVALEVDSVDPDPGQGVPYPPTLRQKESLTGTGSSSSLSISPDPGNGSKYPPS
ncbi:MAG: hypothetical protein JST05_10510 [Acidobacteria bacterium]|nr:hypothetical protein [Acidobacteriota bacterium]